MCTYRCIFIVAALRACRRYAGVALLAINFLSLFRSPFIHAMCYACDVPDNVAGSYMCPFTRTTLPRRSEKLLVFSFFYFSSLSFICSFFRFSFVATLFRDARIELLLGLRIADWIRCDWKESGACAFGTILMTRGVRLYLPASEEVELIFL